MKKIMAMTVVLTLLLLSVFPVYAENDAQLHDDANNALLDELVSLTKESYLFYRMITTEFLSIVHDNNDEVKEFALKKGYVDAELVGTQEKETVFVDVIDEVKFDYPYYPYSAQMNTKEKWEEAVKEYFVWDMYGLVTPTNGSFHNWLVEYDGRFYGTSAFDNYNHPYWDTAKLVSYDQNNATISVMVEAEGIGGIHPFTVTFQNTKNGWRISGGTFGEQVYYMLNNGPIVNPPVTPPAETGDGGVYAAWLAGLALLALGVVIRRKKKI
ncbi:MAG: LPXTG cell wall anchor domain-containing protein [Ruminococcaceae bacterium]|nr:LPXTG cell wall anchor domain-containing protein [Oscillospiraceae bacterium]